MQQFLRLSKGFNDATGTNLVLFIILGLFYRNIQGHSSQYYLAPMSIGVKIIMAWIAKRRAMISPIF